MKNCSLILSLLCAVISVTFATDYCDNSLCGSRTHIACGNSGDFAPTCPEDAEMVNIDATLQNLLVKAHNKNRNFVAGGGNSKLGKACRMATMKWNAELASLAAYNVKQCVMEHDDCRNTNTFRYSGQNLAWLGYFEPVNDAEQLQSAVDNWFSEIKDTKMSYINKYPNNYKGPAIGHFTVMMADRNTDVGCAAATYSVPGKSYKAYLVACNYATTNMIDFPIYQSCTKAGSQCQKGTNPNYKNLCATSEVYNVNKWY